MQISLRLNDLKTAQRGLHDNVLQFMVLGNVFGGKVPSLNKMPA